MAKLDLTGLMTGLPTDQDLRTQGQARAAQIQGSGLGSNLARGIASRAPQREEMMRQGLGGMFGVDTRTGDQQQTARMQQALSGLKLDTPEGLMQLAKIKQATGDTAGAIQIMQQVEAQKKAEAVNKAKADRVVNIRNAVVTRIETDPRYDDILPVIQQGLFDDNPEELIKLLKRDTVEGIKLGKPFAGQTPTGSPVMLTIKSEPGKDDVIVDLAGVAPPAGTILSTTDGTKVEVNLTGETEDAFSKALGKGLADDLIESRNKAATSVLTGSVLNNQWKLIDEGLGILSGTGTNVLMGVGKVLSAAGVLSGEGADLIANTEAFLGNAGNLVAEAITAFGAGTGLSDADRDFAKQIVAGDPAAFTEEGIRRILKLQAHIVKFKVEQHNKKVANSPAASSVYDMSVPVPSFPWAESERAASNVDAQTQALIDKYTKGKE